MGDTSIEEIKIDELNQDIENLKKAYKKINEALDFLKDVESYSEEEYSQLYYLGENINDLLINKINELEWRKENGIYKKS